MKLLLILALAVGTSSRTFAQLPTNTISSAQSGEYLLEGSKEKQPAKKLKVSQSQLVIKNDQGKNTKFTSEEVRYVRIGARRYVTTTGFNIKSGFGTSVIDKRVFVELLDSGQVSLMSYQYAPGGGSAFGGGQTLTTYLLQYNDEAEATTIPYSIYTGSGKRFREAVAPYVAIRPDLRKLLMDGNISINNFAEFIHALNTGKPYAGTLLTPASSDED